MAKDKIQQKTQDKSVQKIITVQNPKNPGFLWFRKTFTSGLLVLIPTALTIYILWFIFNKLDGIISKVIRRIIFQYSDSYVIKLFDIPYLGPFQKFPFPGLGIAILILLIIIIGILVRYIFGTRFVSIVEKTIKKVPLISLIYFGIKQISYVFIREKGAIFREAVLLEYPRAGIYSIGFVTTETKGKFHNVVKLKKESYSSGSEDLQKRDSIIEELNSKNMLSVFIPTTPNPTSGYLLYVPEDQLIPLDIGIEDAMKLIISAGTVSPDEDVDMENFSHL